MFKCSTNKRFYNTQVLVSFTSHPCLLNVIRTGGMSYVRNNHLCYITSSSCVESGNPSTKTILCETCDSTWLRSLQKLILVLWLKRRQNHSNTMHKHFMYVLNDRWWIDQILDLVIRTVQTAPWIRWRESPRGGGRNWTGFRLCVPGDLSGWHFGSTDRLPIEMMAPKSLQ